MDKDDRFQSLTLWFAAVIFIQTDAGNAGGPALAVAAIVALAITYLVPLYLLVGVAADVVAE